MMKTVLVVLVLLCCGLSTYGVEFGHDMRSYFVFAEDWTNINHGSYGAVPIPVLQTLQSYELQAESKPDVWFRGGYQELVEQVRAVLASFVNAGDEDELVLVENASSGVNAVLRSLNLTSGDRVLILERAYQMVINTLDYLAEREGIEVLTVPGFTYPLTSPDTVVDTVTAFIKANLPIDLCVFSHIESTPATVLPIAELISVAHSYGIPVLIDGAHALGNVEIDIQALDADYYLSNAHKWLFSPKGTAFLWVRQDLQSEIVPTVISSEFNASDFVQRFEYTGTRDYAAYCSIPSAIEFRETIGGEEAIREYNWNLAWEAAEYLADLWNTTILEPQSMASSMVDVRFPSDDATLATYVRDELENTYNEYLVTYQLSDGSIWNRLSGQIYLDMSDFEAVGDRVLALIQQYNNEQDTAVQDNLSFHM